MRLPLRACLVALLLTLVTAQQHYSAESYTEQLIVTPLADGKVLSNFTFQLSGPWSRTGGQRIASNVEATHHTILPSALTSVLALYSVSSFHLTLSSGRWLPHWPTHWTPASGIQLTAWLERRAGEDDAAEQRRWEDLTAVLGGIFCAGISKGMEGAGRGVPGWSKEYQGPQGRELDHSLYHATMPRLSATCTESLTPFVSLMPCASRAGLSSLLNPHQLFDSEFTLIGVHYVRDETSGRFTFNVGSVADPVRKHRLAGGMGKRDFSLQSLYDRELLAPCPVASSSTVSIAVPQDSVNPFQVDPSDAQSKVTRDDKSYVEWDIQNVDLAQPFNAGVSWPTESAFRFPAPSKLPRPPIAVRRLLSGYGQERGRIGIEVINNLNETAEAIWVEQWPWWVRGFVGTLQASSDTLSTEGQIASLDYSPAVARRRPSTLQVLLSLPPLSTCQFELDYESAYLWYTEYPSDAHRGFELAGAEVVLLRPRSGAPGSSRRRQRPLTAQDVHLRLHTTSTLLSLPTPDFSMPYNVIILTSTVIALFFGSVVNGLLRGWYVVDVSEVEGEDDSQREVDGKKS